MSEELRALEIRKDNALARFRRCEDTLWLLECKRERLLREYAEAFNAYRKALYEEQIAAGKDV